jgi:hypothetical protein
LSDQEPAPQQIEAVHVPSHDQGHDDRMFDRDVLPTAWLVLAFGEERQYAGKAGYEDVPTTRYRYDNYVPNHKQVAAGDVFLVRGVDTLHGCARVDQIEQGRGVKQRRRCPTCETTALKPRARKKPRYRCDKGHEFDEPLADEVPVTVFTAHFGTSYVPAQGAISLAELRSACPMWNGQHAIQRIDLSSVISRLAGLPGFRERVLGESPSPSLGPEEASTQNPYIPGDVDTRAVAQRQVRERRGQAAFRRALIRRYGARCLVTGCALLDLLEAAHIRPYRGDDDHHAENGLLLRSDLQTLFDLDLIGIDPETLVIHLHSAVSSADTGYAHFNGVRLGCSSERPSVAALRLRWSEFMRKSGQKAQ